MLSVTTSTLMLSLVHTSFIILLVLLPQAVKCIDNTTALEHQ
jgi:hypothetical protein